jgi:hypothetical protein
MVAVWAAVEGEESVVLVVENSSIHLQNYQIQRIVNILVCACD